MSQKLLIALDSGTAPQRDAVSAFVRAKGWGAWHWVDDLWLLNDVPPGVSPREVWVELTASDRALVPVKGIVLRPDGETPYWGGNVPESWPPLKKIWGQADFPGPQVRPENEGEMADSSDARRLRIDDAAAADDVAAVDPPEPAGPVTYLCRTLAVGTYPTAAAAFYSVVALAASGTETEGSAGVTSDASGAFRALNVGTTVPPVGSKVLVTFVSYRWVFRWSG